MDYMDSVVWSSVNVGRMADISAAYFSREFEGKSIFSLEQAQKGMSQFVSVFSQAVPAEALQWEEAEAAEAFQQGKTALLLAGEDVYPFLEENMEEGEWGALPFTPEAELVWPYSRMISRDGACPLLRRRQRRQFIFSAFYPTQTTIHICQR